MFASLKFRNIFKNSNKYLGFKNIQIFTFSTRKERLTNIITNEYNPTHLEVINESSGHSVPKDSETHFKLIIVSKNFENKTPIEIHQNVYKLLKEEMGEKRDNKLHAISLVTKTPEEWNTILNREYKSPNCMGGKS